MFLAAFLPRRGDSRHPVDFTSIVVPLHGGIGIHIADSHPHRGPPVSWGKSGSISVEHQCRTQTISSGSVSVDTKITEDLVREVETETSPEDIVKIEITISIGLPAHSWQHEPWSGNCLPRGTATASATARAARGARTARGLPRERDSFGDRRGQDCSSHFVYGPGPRCSRHGDDFPTHGASIG